MIEAGIFWLRVAACLYAVGLLHSLLTTVRAGQSIFGLAMTTFRIGVVVQGVAIVDQWIATGRVPLENPYQALSLCAFLTALTFVATERRYNFGGASIALFPFVFAMTVGATLEQSASGGQSGMRDFWLIMHILLVVAAYAALFFMALSAVAYLIQERRLKNKQGSALLERLPPLATLDAMLSKSLGWGFAFLTLGLVFSVMWAMIYLPTNWIGNPNIGISMLTWVLLLVMLFLRSSAGWRGRRAAVMALVVLGCSALTWVTHAGLEAALAP
jgi:ABC-type uncharacterized transport system permease subunit